MPDYQPLAFTQLVNLASPILGATVVSASDEFFTGKEAVLDPADPVGDDARFTDRGRWVDGWLTRRRREPGWEWITLGFGQAGLVEGVEVDFRHLAGNCPDSISIDACMLPTMTPINRFTVDRFLWSQLLPQTQIEPGVVNRFQINSLYRYTHLRFNLHPDGGIARIRVWGTAVRERLDGETDLAAIHNGAFICAVSDQTFGAVRNMLMPGEPASAADGWCTRRLRGEPGYEWAEIELPGEAVIRRIEVDTAFYHGDYPDLCQLDDCATGRVLLDPTPLHVDQVNRLAPTAANVPVERVRFRIYPDGGVARLRMYGSLTERGREFHRILLRNTLPPPDAVVWFQQCLGSEEWARQMTSARPFANMDQMTETGNRLASVLGLKSDAGALRAKLQL